MSVSKHSLEIAEMEKENEQLRAYLERAGWGPCNIPACNCNGWHHLRPSRYEQEMINEAVEQWKDRATAAEFRLSCAVNANTDHEQDYLAVWKLIKQPNETVVDAVKRVVGELRTERERVKEAGVLLGKWMDSYAYGIPQHDINVATYGFMKESALSHSGKEGV